MAPRALKALAAAISGNDTATLAHRVDEAEAQVKAANARLAEAERAHREADPLLEDEELDRFDAAVSAALSVRDRQAARLEAYRALHTKAVAADTEAARLTRRKMAVVQAGDLALVLPGRIATLMAEIDDLILTTDRHQAELVAVNAERQPDEPEITDAVTRLLRRPGLDEEIVKSEIFTSWTRTGSARPLSPDAARSVRIQEDGSGALDGDSERPCQRRTFRREAFRPAVSATENRNPLDQLRAVDTTMAMNMPTERPQPALIERIILLRDHNDG